MESCQSWSNGPRWKRVKCNSYKRSNRLLSAILGITYNDFLEKCCLNCKHYKKLLQSYDVVILYIFFKKPLINIYLYDSYKEEHQ